MKEDADGDSDDDERVDDVAEFIEKPCKTDNDCGRSGFLMCKEWIVKN